MELHIREATTTDYEALCMLFDEGDALHREHLPQVFRKPEGPVRDREFVLSLIAEEKVGLFVAQAENELAGLICVLVRESPAIPIFVPRRYAVIDNILVRDRFRRRGVGRALVERAHEWAAGQGVKEIELNVWAFNRDAVAFYRRLGYETAALRMTRRLG